VFGVLLGSSIDLDLTLAVVTAALSPPWGLTNEQLADKEQRDGLIYLQHLTQPQVVTWLAEL
jgi:hypothetical protein